MNEQRSPWTLLEFLTSLNLLRHCQQEGQQQQHLTLQTKDNVVMGGEDHQVAKMMI